MLCCKFTLAIYVINQKSGGPKRFLTSFLDLDHTQLTAEQTPYADEDHKMWLKAPENW